MKLHLVLAPPLSSATQISGPTTPSDSDEQEPDRQTRGEKETIVSLNVKFLHHSVFNF